MIASRTFALLMAAIAGGVVLQPWHAQAQWWGSRGPADFEECADTAEKAATREARTAALSECNAKFAGRRKPGGGYTYFDFMQNRNFDIAGPNPTPEEQKRIDEQYTAYLDDQRRSNIAAAFAAKQQQLQQTSLKNENDKPPLTTASPGKPQAAAGGIRRIQNHGLPAAVLLLRMATAFRKHQGPEEGIVRFAFEQGKAKLIPRRQGQGLSNP